jgi:NAD(P)-dependent dehydrogenase (short-subunit alcohol dehydrogenase family)
MLCAGIPFHPAIRDYPKSEEVQPMSLSGRRALITGAGQGIGRACAEVFLEQGADVVLLDKNPDTLNKTVESLSRERAQVVSHEVDVTDIDGLKTVLEKAREAGPIDILVNNAGFDRPGTTEKIDTSGFLEVVGIHLVAPLVLIQALLPGMISSGWGRIINVGSIYGLMGAKGELAYSTAKAGILGFTKSVAREAGAQGVTVNAVLPGLIRTPTIEKCMAEKYKRPIIEDTPMGRIGEPEEVAQVIAFLASENASFITGAAIPVSGGWGM